MRGLKKLKVVGKWFLWVVPAVIAIQLGYFLVVLNMPTSLTPTEAVVIFGGSEKRIQFGYAVAHQQQAAYIILSPATETDMALKDAKYELRPATRRLLEPHARTTFENAWFTSRIIKEKRLKSVTLVTSNYHAPRSLALLRMFLLGQGVSIQVCKVTPLDTGDGAIPQAYRSKISKLTYNEMLDFWGSLAESAVFLVTREIPKTTINQSAAFVFLKSLVRADVQPDW